MEEIVSKKQKKIKEVQSFTSLVLENEQIMYRIARSRFEHYFEHFCKEHQIAKPSSVYDTR